jgi:hypothetical protein
MLIKRKDWNDVGVSEVIGTILILGMTVTLFSAVLIWVYTIPTPTPSIKVDFVGQLEPIYRTGVWDGVNITVRHNSGEALQFSTTKLYLTIQVGTNRHVDQFSNVGKITIPPYYASPADNNKPYGLIDGSDNIWNAGERWFYTNHKITQTDTVEVMIVDTGKSVLLWRATLQGLAGLNPPVFVDKWADKDPTTSIREPPATNVQFYVYANVIDPDGDLNKQSVYVSFAALFGIPDFRNQPWKMRDNGTGGDQVANDGIFTLTGSWLKPVNMSWDGSVVIFNATDMQGHKTTARMTLTVVQGPAGGGTTPGKRPGSGAPPNLNYNGLQGYNIFNATEWDNNDYAANETRTFKEKETVVVVVASALLRNSKGAHDEFFMYDPFSNLPPEYVVYGTIKVPTADTQASNTAAFTYYDYVNGYNVFTYRFELNNASSVGINYFLNNPTHPPYYFFGRYPLEITLWDDVTPQPNKFHTTDTINITDNNGNMRLYPMLETFKDSGFTQKSNTFNSTDVVYVRVTMKTVDTTYYMGNIVIQDYLGGTQVWKAPLSGKNVNEPICPVTGACTAGLLAVEKHDGSISYRFALNLSLVNQDPWVPGTQNYALRVISIRDADEEYTLALQSQLTIRAPEYQLDIAIANDDTMDPRWGTHDLGYYLENVNSWDRWTKYRILSGPSDATKWIAGVAIKYLDFDQDGDLDIAASLKQDQNTAWLYLFRRDLDTSGNTVWTPFILENTGNDLITAIVTGSIDRDTAPEIIVGSTSGKVWYYKNDGSWTKVSVDISRSGQVNSIDLGDFDGDHDMDIAVARNGNTKEVTWYPNIDGNGKFTTTQQTDWWRATQENTVYGSIVSGDYTSTFTSDSAYEQFREEKKNFPTTYSNDTANQEASFTYGSIDSGSYTDTRSDNSVYETLLEGTCQANKYCLQAYWTFNVPAGSSHKVKLNGYKSSGSNPNDDFKFQYATSTSGPWTDMFTVTNTSDTGYSYSYTLPSGTSGNVYIRVLDTVQSNGETADRTYVDYMYIETVIPAGERSALEHYWKLQTLPNRPGSSYTLYVVGYRPNNAEADNFAFYYSTSGQSGPYIGPTITVSQPAPDTTFSYVLPNLGGQSIWIKVVDTDRTINNINLDDLYVNVLNITVQTPGGVTGIDINLDDGANGMVLDAGNQNSGPTDTFDDLVVGTSAGNVYKLMGSAGGLIPPSQKFASPGGSITGVKLADCYLTKTGLEVVTSTGTSVYIYTGFGTTGTLIKTLTTPGGEATKALAAGDIDGDGDDDIVVTTGGTNIGHVVYYRNNAGNWVNPNVPGFLVGVPIWAIDLGDASNANHRGR